MAFQMVDADGRNAQRMGEAARERGAGEKCAGQAGPLGVGDGAYLADFSPGLGKDLPAQRHQPPNVVAGGELGDDAPVGFVHRDLRMHLMREQLPGPGVI